MKYGTCILVLLALLTPAAHTSTQPGAPLYGAVAVPAPMDAPVRVSMAQLPIAAAAAVPAAAKAAAVARSAAARVPLLDRALMALFGVGLVSYQLGRKHRLLEHTALSSGSL